MKIFFAIIQCILIVLLAIWLVLFVWVHQPFGQLLTIITLMIWFLLTIICLVSVVKAHILPKFINSRDILLSYFLIIALAMVGFFTITASNQREWNDEVSQMLDFTLSNDGKMVKIDNVRNFDWIDEQNYQQKWETRHYQIDDLQSVDLVASYWMGEPIAHTFVSFGFKDGQKLAFSIEIRKEKQEEFSSIAGFFRKFEMIIIASDEKDVIYTRSNIRHEDVYIYPIIYNKNDIKQLFMAYLNQAKNLQQQPKWYNTILNNCTTAMYQLVKPITPVPLDYRLLASGYLPNYLYDKGVIDNQFSLSEWKQKAYINPKTKQYSVENPISSQDFSKIIRQDF